MAIVLTKEEEIVDRLVENLTENINGIVVKWMRFGEGGILEYLSRILEVILVHPLRLGIYQTTLSLFDENDHNLRIDIEESQRGMIGMMRTHYRRFFGQKITNSVIGFQQEIIYRGFKYNGRLEERVDRLLWTKALIDQACLGVEIEFQGEYNIEIKVLFLAALKNLFVRRRIPREVFLDLYSYLQGIYSEYHIS